MSRIGKVPVSIPSGVKVEIKEGTIFVESGKGKLSLKIPSNIEVVKDDKEIRVRPLSNDKLSRSLYGTMRALIFNMVKGVSEGYKKELEIVGVGYRAQMKGKDLVMQIGFSHPVEVKVPDDLKVSVQGNNRIIVEGIDKQKVGQFAANIRKILPPEPYKGKGIRYVGEVVRKKLGKAMAK